LLRQRRPRGIGTLDRRRTGRRAGDPLPVLGAGSHPVVGQPRGVQRRWLAARRGPSRRPHRARGQEHPLPRGGYLMRIPADVDREDPLVFGLSARQLCILGGAALAAWLAYEVMRPLLPAPLAVAFGAPLLAMGIVIA